jgi:hypothetical protein
VSHKVNYREKNGAAASATFPTFALAVGYARTVKCGVVEPGGCDDAFSVTKCGSREEEEAKRARAGASLAREREAEAYIEAGVQARLTGASVSDALDAAVVAAAEVRGVCGCGKPCPRGMTACYTCRRYA